MLHIRAGWAKGYAATRVMTRMGLQTSAIGDCLGRAKG